MIISLTDKVAAATSAFSATVDEDIILFEPDSGTYFGSGSVGARIWTLIDHEIEVAKLCGMLIEEFSVDRHTCEREVVAFLSQLEAHGLVTVT